MKEHYKLNGLRLLKLILRLQRRNTSNIKTVDIDDDDTAKLTVYYNKKHIYNNVFQIYIVVYASMYVIR